MITACSSKSEVVAALLSGSKSACAEFIRRLPHDALPGLERALDVLSLAIWTRQWADPRMMRWESPDRLPALAPEIFRGALERAVRNDKPGVRRELAGLSLEQLSAAESIATKLARALVLHQSDLACSGPPACGADPELSFSPYGPA